MDLVRAAGAGCGGRRVMWCRKEVQTLTPLQDGLTPLHWAASGGHIAVIRVFLADHRVAVSTRGKVSEMAHVACLQPLSLCPAHSFDRQAGKSALDVAREKGWIDAAKLIEADARAERRIPA